MSEDKSQAMKYVRMDILNTFIELDRIGRINNHELIVQQFMDRAVWILTDEYWDEDNFQRLSDYLDIKYDKRQKLSTVEWTRFFEKWKNMNKKVIDKVPYEKRKQWMDQIESFQETDLIKKTKVNCIFDFEHPLFKEGEKMFLVLFYEIKQYLRPLVSQMDFSWCEKYVNEIVSNKSIYVL